MRKPIRIEHVRCGEPCGWTYLWALAGKTEDDIQHDADLAAERHLEAIRAFEKVHECPGPMHLENCPDSMTIGDAKRFIADQEASRKEYYRLKREAGRSFGDFMCELGYAMIWDFEDGEVFEAVINWGHRHGAHIEMSETMQEDIDVKIPSPADDDDIYGLI